MEHKKPKLFMIIPKWLYLLGLILVVSLCLFLSLRQLLGWTFAEIYDPCQDPQLEECNFTEKNPEDIFVKYVWETIPPQVTQIEGVEGIVPFSEGPAFIRFETTDSFITELIGKYYNNYGAYSSAPCTVFYNISQHHELIQNFPGKFKWWNPSEVTAPVCYTAQGQQDDDTKHLLIDSHNGLVYFYRTATCGLCPD